MPIKSFTFDSDGGRVYRCAIAAVDPGNTFPNLDNLSSVQFDITDDLLQLRAGNEHNCSSTRLAFLGSDEPALSAGTVSFDPTWFHYTRGPYVAPSYTYLPVYDTWKGSYAFGLNAAEGQEVNDFFYNTSITAWGSTVSGTTLSNPPSQPFGSDIAAGDGVLVFAASPQYETVPSDGCKAVSVSDSGGNTYTHMSSMTMDFQPFTPTALEGVHVEAFWCSSVANADPSTITGTWDNAVRNKIMWAFRFSGHDGDPFGFESWGDFSMSSFGADRVPAQFLQQIYRRSDI